MKIEIKNRWTGSIIFSWECEKNTISKTVKEYIRQEVEVNNKYRANLTDANLTRANLTRADLTDADLTDADLTDANLTDADLTRANLTRANLTRADLTRPNLTLFKNDLWRVLLQNKTEIEGLKLALKEGRVKGTAYEGKCACLKGTIANVKGCSIKEAGLIEDVREPSEQWFLQIQKGQTPENSNVVKLTVEWIEEFELLLNR